MTSGDKDWWKKNSGPAPEPQTDRRFDVGDRRWKDVQHIGGDLAHGEIVARYRKIFPWFPYEADTRPGNEFCVFDILDIERFGLCIFYDMLFPELAHTLAWMGAEIILQPTLTPTSDRPLELVMARANALFNQCYFVSINGVGEWSGGRSTIIDPDGRILQEAGTSQTFLAR